MLLSNRLPLRLQGGWPRHLAHRSSSSLKVWAVVPKAPSRVDTASAPSAAGLSVLAAVGTTGRERVRARGNLL